jgi:glyoxylase-like metal-dependent hydrolase (beta-lactamase superfamily II)
VVERGPRGVAGGVGEVGVKQEQEQASPEVTEVAPDVLRMQLPIRMPGLGHVNMYGLLDDRGVAIVDPGLPGPASWRAVRARLASAGIPIRRVHTVLVTHSHPDHFGSAGRLAREAGAELVTHETFQTWMGPHRCTETSHDHEPGEECEESEAPQSPWSRPTPWGTAFYRPPLKRRIQMTVGRRFLRRMFSPPDPSRRVADGEVLRLAGREWFARHTPGHTVDHLCLHDPEGGVLLTGDHVLPTITPHISGITAGDDPLSDYLASLDAVAALGDVSRVLPAHGHPFDDLGGRVKEIKEHHDERMADLVAAGQELGWASVPALSQRIFRRRSWGSMAESETYAHLEHLRLAGRAERRGEGAALEYLIG